MVIREGNSYIFYEPGQDEILDRIIPRFTALQVYQAIMESLASEHAARMVAMKNATDNATELSEALQLEYNKARQQSITSEMLDIAGGAEALTQELDFNYQKPVKRSLNMEERMEKAKGRIIQIQGGVVDVEFSAEELARDF